MTRRERRRDRALWVVKLGGSLALSPLLPEWLNVLGAGGGRLVVVPGGGPFADAVRKMQERWRFGDAAAHHLALLAMEQYGRMLSGLSSALRPAVSAAGIRRLLREGAVPVWMPTGMALGRPDIPESWEVTSDSLAAWLAAQLEADCLILVKSVAVAAGRTVEELARLGIVDPALPAFVARGQAECRCIEAGRHAEMARALATGVAPATLVGKAACKRAGRGRIAGDGCRANIRR